MRIAIVAAGAAGMYCGSCIRDSALAVELRALGHAVTFVPLYTPLRLDEPGVEQEDVFLGGVRVYAEELLPLLRGGGRLWRLLGSRRLLRWVSRLGVESEPNKLGPLTVSMLRGESGHQRASIDELLRWLTEHVRADVVHLSNSLLSGLAAGIHDATGAPVTCGLSGEELFVDSLPEPYRAEAVALVARNAESVARYLAPSEAYAERIASWCDIPREKIAVVLPGVRTTDYEETAPRPSDSPLAVGFFARIAPEKGLHLLADAFARLAPEFPSLQLKIAGYLGRSARKYLRRVRRGLAARGLGARVEILGTLARAEKLEFLRSIDVFAVPSTVPESKALSLVESLLAGVPAVVPDHGSIPEIVRAAGGAVLHTPNDVTDLAQKLGDLLRDEPRRRDLGARGRAGALTELSARRMAVDTARVFESVLAQARGASS